LARTKRWSRDVTDNSNALDLEPNVFTKESPRAIAQSLKRSAEQSTRRKSDPYRSAMSMLVSTSTAQARTCHGRGARSWSRRRTSC